MTQRTESPRAARYSRGARRLSIGRCSASSLGVQKMCGHRGRREPAQHRLPEPPAGQGAGAGTPLD